LGLVDFAPEESDGATDYPETTRAGAPISGAALGTAKRFADSIDRRVDARIAEGIKRGNQPDTLTPTKLQFDKEPLTLTPIARPMKAWVRYAGAPLLIDADAVA
jgi:hypothetical protein